MRRLLSQRGIVIALGSLLLVSGAGIYLVRSQTQLRPERTRLESEKRELAAPQAILEQRRQRLLGEYFEQMEGLFKQGLKTTSPSLNVVRQAEALTQEFLLPLDGKGKGALLKFLYQEELIGQCLLSAAKQDCSMPGRRPVLSLVGADLRRVQLQDTSLSGADLRGTDLRGADLRHSDLTRVRLNKANLSGANLSGARLFGADLSDAYLRVATLQKTQLGCENGHYCREPASLNQVDLKSADLTEANLGRTSLVGANLQGAVLVEAKLAGADLSGASFVATDLSGASFSHYWKGSCSDPGWEVDLAQMNQTDFTGANLTGADFTGFMLDSSGIQGAEMTGANLESARTGNGPDANEC